MVLQYFISVHIPTHEQTHVSFSYCLSGSQINRVALAAYMF